MGLAGVALNAAGASLDGRSASVDALRGLAVSAVLLLHFTLAYGLKDSLLGDLVPPPLLRAVALNGNYGVTMFFVISGFLITTLSLRRWGRLERIDLRAFYALRAARILPPLLLALALIVGLGLAGLPYFTNTDNGQHLPASFYGVAVGSVLSFWHNVLMQRTGYFNYCLNVYWSLSVEEMFYLLLPLSCRLLRRPAWLVLGCIACIVCGPLYRWAHADNEIFYLYAYPACFDALAMGILAALAVDRRAPAGAAARGAAALGLLALATVWLQGIEGHEATGFSLVALATAVCLYGSAAAGLGGTARALSAPLRWLGRHSYELYLFHIIVLGLMRNVFERADLSHGLRLPALLAFFAASALVAAAVSRGLSEPANRWLRQRFVPQLQPVPPGSAGALQRATLHPRWPTT